MLATCMLLCCLLGTALNWSSAALLLPVSQSVVVTGHAHAAVTVRHGDHGAERHVTWTRSSCMLAICSCSMVGRLQLLGTGTQLSVLVGPPRRLRACFRRLSRSSDSQ